MLKRKKIEQISEAKIATICDRNADPVIEPNYIIFYFGPKCGWDMASIWIQDGILLEVSQT